MSDTENSSAGVSLPEEPPSSRSPSPTTANKRKRDAASEPAVEETVRRKKKGKTWAAEDGDLDVQSGINNAIGRMDGRLLADYVAQRTKRFGGDLSLVELEDRHIPGEQNVTPDILGALHSLPVKYLPLGSNAEKAFLDTSSWAKPRELSSLPEFLEHYSTTPGKAKNLSSSSKLKGAPHTIVVTGAGLRAADLTRCLS